MLQMTSISASGMIMTYNYSPTQNNGQITSSVDGVTGETVTYQYDALKRLASASGKNWGETYSYDGYGNLTNMLPTGTAGAPSLNLTVALDANNVPTNRINATGVGYDANGNQTQGFAGYTFTYDVVNRVTAVSGTGTAAYGYDSDNRRIYSRSASGAETIYFYGVDGKKLAAYTPSIITYGGFPEVQLSMQTYNVYFLGKLIYAEGNSVQTDRLGSVRSGGPGGLGYQAQYPYGAEDTLTANDREKYATYTRDSATGLDYAMNRYYASQWGRFLSPDANWGSAGPQEPQSWNRYVYAAGDPANHRDPSGLDVDPGSDPGDPDPPYSGGPNEPPFACDLFGGCNGCPNDLWDGGYGFLPMPGPFGPFCPFLPLPVPAPSPAAPPQVSLQEIGDCVQPKGNNATAYWTLEVEYQVLVNGQTVAGNSTLTNYGITMIAENITNATFDVNGAGVWCLSTFTGCPSPRADGGSGLPWHLLGRACGKRNG